MSKRLKLHKMLCEILSCPEKGPDNRVYYQPPSNIKMIYPAIVYSLSDIDIRYANDGVYLFLRKYTVTIIDPNPDSELVDKVAVLQNANYDRTYTKDNLNHFVFEIYV